MITVPEEAAAIRQAFEDFALGKNAHEIARSWNELGLKPRSLRGIDYFQPQTVRQMLENRVYLGQVSHLGAWRQGRHEAIVTPEVFAAAQRRQVSVPRRVHPPRPLRGVAVCPEGHRIYQLCVRHSPKEPYRKHYYYREPSPDFGRDCAQSGALWNANEVDAQLDVLLHEFTMDAGCIQHVEETARRAAPPNVGQQLARLGQRRDRLQEDFYEGRLDKQPYLDRYGACDREIRRLSALEQPDLGEVERIKQFGDLWSGASPDARNEMCRLLFDRVILDFEQRQITFVPAPEFERLFGDRAVYVRQTSPGPGSRSREKRMATSARCS
jgi:hypothetical protein